MVFSEGKRGRFIFKYKKAPEIEDFCTHSYVPIT